MTEHTTSCGQTVNDVAQSPLSVKLGSIVRWLLIEAAPVVDADDRNWKITIHGGPGQDMRAVLEQFKTI